MSIKSILDELEQLSGNAKLNKLKDYMSTPYGGLIEMLFHATYNTELNYYIRPTEYKSTDTPLIALSEAIDAIRVNLASRLVTGNAAHSFFESLTSRMSADDAEVLTRVLNRDLRVGINVSTANKALSVPIPTFDVMLCGKSDEKNLKKFSFKEPAIVQEKSDGLRIIVTVNNSGDVQFRTRNGKSMDFPSLVPEFSKFIGKAFDGEALVAGPDGSILDRKTGNGILNSIQKGDLSQEPNVRLVLWDMMSYDAFMSGKDATPYSVRFRNLELAIPTFGGKCILQDSKTVSSLEEVEQIFRQKLAEGKEGVILKEPNSPYETKRVNHQLKFKAELTADLRIIGVEEGTGKNVGKLGALVLTSGDGAVEVNVGTGFSDAQREEFWNNKDGLIGRIVEVNYNETITSKGKTKKSLFLPVFVELRMDKDQADII